MGFGDHMPKCRTQPAGRENRDRDPAPDKKITYDRVQFLNGYLALLDIDRKRLVGIPMLKLRFRIGHHCLYKAPFSLEKMAYMT